MTSQVEIASAAYMQACSEHAAIKAERRENMGAEWAAETKRLEAFAAYTEARKAAGQ